MVREGDHSSYVDEDAIAPGYGGGLAVVIPDVTLDERISQDLCRPTYARSLATVITCRPIAERHGGSIWAEPETHGAPFVVWLPDAATPRMVTSDIT